ncbi:RNA methyltransferase [Arenibacter aquaticus]|uniref:RNA methyltransferase n=1 Tax=Arenibacter aquaticus TaxID=2489054 RepID=A0A3S0AY35_9FLAO|nr:RNA methyltransferase [Arenibacter aquaticus]RTE53022.1 RNA methyltransferase [Arenibacter aquaticus]
MSYLKAITSPQNPTVKNILSLKEKSRERRKKGLFVLEGKKELQLALKGEYQLVTVLFCPELISLDEIQDIIQNTVPAPEIISISKEIYQKIAYRDTTEGIVALGKTKEHSLDTLQFENDNPLILVAEAPEKPGNIGALLRTADAADLDGVIIANARGDLYNPNIIRSSVGCLFTTKTALGTTTEVLDYLKQHQIAINCAALSASKSYTKVDLTQPTAIVVGTEATGLSNEWLQNATQNIIIPMHGQIDSMNVSVSAAILIFEARRQRGF